MPIVEDVYSLKFDSAQFEAGINQSIAKLEELSAVAEETATSTEDLEAAIADLTASLKVEAKGTEDLNKKRDVLVNTQKKLNAESKAYTAVGAEIDNTNKKIAASTADTTTKQKGLFGGFLQGARNLNSLKRASGLVLGAFRLLGAFNPVGLAITAVTAAIGIFSQFIGTANKTKTALEKLNDPELARSERVQILEEEISRLNEIEKATGQLSEEEQKQRDELTKKYQETSDEIVRIEEQRTKRLNDLQDQAARLRVQLLGDTVAGINEKFKTETEILIRDAKTVNTKLFKDLNDAIKRRDEALKDSDSARVKQEEEAIAALQEEIDRVTEVLKLEKAREKQEQALALQRKAEEAARKKAEEDNKRREFDEKLIAEELERQKRLLEEINDLPRPDTEVERSIQARNELLRQEAQRVQELADKYESFSSLITTINNIKTAQQETATANNLALLEQERNAKLFAALQSGKDEETILKQQLEINKQYDAQRLEIERLTNAAIVKSRIDSLEAILKTAKELGQDTLDVEKQLAELRLKLAELDKPANIEVTADTENAKEKIKKLVDEIGQGLVNVGNAVFDAVEQSYQRLIARLDQAIQKSKSALDEIRANSQDFNARQLALEKERLEKLEAERKKAVAREKALAITRIAVDTAVAVAKAAGQTGVGAPIAIAGVLAAIIGGVASALSVAQGANFYEGSEFVDKERRYPSGRDMVPARLNRGERVITTETNREYYNTLSAIHNGRIPASVINNFTSEYIRNGGALPMNLGTPSIIKQMPMILQSGVDMRGVEMRLDNLESVLRGLQMPSVKVTANANGIFKVVEKRRMNAARANKISK